MMELETRAEMMELTYELCLESVRGEFCGQCHQCCDCCGSIDAQLECLRRLSKGSLSRLSMVPKVSAVLYALWIVCFWLSIVVGVVNADTRFAVHQRHSRIAAYASAIQEWNALLAAGIWTNTTLNFSLQLVDGSGQTTSNLTRAGPLVPVGSQELVYDDASVEAGDSVIAPYHPLHLQAQFDLEDSFWDTSQRYMLTLNGWKVPRPFYMPSFSSGIGRLAGCEIILQVDAGMKEEVGLSWAPLSSTVTQFRSLELTVRLSCDPWLVARAFGGSFGPLRERKMRLEIILLSTALLFLVLPIFLGLAICHRIRLIEKALIHAPIPDHHLL